MEGRGVARCCVQCGEVPYQCGEVPQLSATGGGGAARAKPGSRYSHHTPLKGNSNSNSCSCRESRWPVMSNDS